MLPNLPQTDSTVQLSDADIADAIALDNEQVFEELFKQWYSPLCRYAAFLLRDGDEAEETVQQVFVSIWERRKKLQVQSFKSYLYRSVRNAVLNKSQHHQVVERHVDFVQNREANNRADNLYFASELSARIEQAIQTLPEQCALVFRLSRFESFSYAEIAAHLNISVKTVENHMGKALKRMREELKDYLILLILFITNLNHLS